MKTYEDYMMCGPMTDGEEMRNFFDDDDDEEEENENKSYKNRYAR